MSGYHTLRDNKGNVIGTIWDEGNFLILRDRKSNTLGNYDKRANVTRDAKQNVVGQGNLLTMLLRGD